MDSATNVLVDARANIKQEPSAVGPFQELIFFAGNHVLADECDSGKNYLR
jgi:hypothetical protein